MEVYERPLRAEEYYRDAVVFELQAPIEIVCLRECLYRFNVQISDSLKPTHSEFFGHWVDYWQLQSFRGPTCNNADQKYYRLGSRLKLFLESHYKSLTPTEEDASFIVNNAYRCDFFNNNNNLAGGTGVGSISRFCTFKVETSSVYSSLQWAVHSTRHSQNEALSRLNECPVDLSFPEFREFGSLRAGHRLQLRNLFRALEQRSLTFKVKSVLALVLQTLWQAGPPSASDALCKWVRDSHEDLCCPNFTRKLIELAVTIANRHARSWMDHSALLAVVSIVGRIASVTTDSTILSDALRAMILLQDIVAGPNGWIKQIELLLVKSDKFTLEETNKIRLHLIEACCCAVLIFFQDPKEMQKLLIKIGVGKNTLIKKFN